MISVRQLRNSFLVGLLCLLGSGCGGSTNLATTDQSADATALNQVGEVYRSYQLFKGNPPSSLKEASTMERGSPLGVAALKKGDVLVNWGAKLPDTGEETGTTSSPEVLAYQRQVPETGGFVLLLDRTLKKMTAEEFKAAPKAGK